MLSGQSNKNASSCSVGLACHVVLAYVPNDLFTLAALMPRFHEKMIVLRGGCFPLGDINLDCAVTVLVGTFAEEGNSPGSRPAVLDHGEQPFVGLPETELDVLPRCLAGHQARMPRLGFR
jgi:hypothetical protein